MSNSPSFQFTDDELTELAHIQQHDTRDEVRRKVGALLLLAQAESAIEVAAMSGVSKASVYVWYQRFKAQGVEGLATRSRSGRPLKANAAFCQELEQVLAIQPEHLGYPDLDGWTIGVLRHHMARETGIRLSEERLRLLLHRLGYEYGQPANKAFSAFRQPRTPTEFRDWLNRVKGAGPIVGAYTWWKRQGK